ncbi:MAG: rhodanese-like domain-containing protein [Phormidium sp.]
MIEVIITNLNYINPYKEGATIKGFVPGVQHIFVAHLAENLDKLDRSKTIATYCGTGYRASIAASLLQKNGFENVINIPGSWTAWKGAQLPVEQPKQMAGVS